jgi:hypothetical protein
MHAAAVAQTVPPPKEHLRAVRFADVMAHFLRTREKNDEAV